MGYLYEACDEISDFCHQELLRKMRQNISDGILSVLDLIVVNLFRSTQFTNEMGIYFLITKHTAFWNTNMLTHTQVILFKEARPPLVAAIPRFIQLRMPLPPLKPMGQSRRGVSHLMEATP
jgi:hypothetical protein